MFKIVSGDGVHMSGRRFFEREHRGRMVVGWMHDHMRETLQTLIDRYQVKSVIEVGSFLGLSACWFAERVDEVVCVDIFEKDMMGSVMKDAMAIAPAGSVENMYDLFLENTKAYPNITSHKMPSLEAAKLDLEADLVYIDADHTYEGVTADIKAWESHARKVVCGDDNTPAWPSVQQAAREYGANVDERIWWKPV